MGLSSVLVGRSWAHLGPIFGDFGPIFGDLGPILGLSPAILTDLGPSSAMLGSLVRLRRCWADLGPTSGDMDRSWPIFGDVGPILGPSSVLVGRPWAHLRPIFGDFRPIFGDLGPILTDLGSSSAINFASKLCMFLWFWLHFRPSGRSGDLGRIFSPSLALGRSWAYLRRS